MPEIPVPELTRTATEILVAAGAEPDKARDMAEVLIEADLIGHRTHGLALLPGYVAALASGEMAGRGSLEVLSERGGCLTLEGNMLPGPWLVRQAMAMAYERLPQHGVVTIAIARSHHIGALAAYLRDAAERGYVALIECSTASVGRMAPFGGIDPVLTPNPAAIGLPTGTDPVLIDISATITTTTMTRTLAADGAHYPEDWALTAEGTPTDDPRAVTEHGGTLLPLGGARKGHKGYAMALRVDLLSQGLAGFGRADHPGPMSLAVFVQLIDPGAFAGLAAFTRQSSHTTALCRDARPVPGGPPVRVPGDAAAAHRRAALARGISLPADLLEELAALARRLGADWQLGHPAPAG
ncbi:Ldh family oxidoreductase [Pseudooceanicola sp. GBMRC 2024]|uniref:Ldh family oxidoreductase n=1 Tax=Pseudooceanicola albus TaxID=2692189 RepID=A0A6L7G212_9RHOB|nr:Ldh family oxidoreductase [Pseudooceanicola albus]MXN17929.1 Ldh family oxidoreductase [Pseudooceanicola albus]